MYAIVRVGGKQYRVEKGDSVVVDRMREDAGASVNLEPLLLAGDGKNKTVFERDDLAKVKVEAVVAGHERGPKVQVLKFKPKKGYKRRSGHRSDLTRLEIKDIKMLSRRPAAKKEGATAEAPKKLAPSRRGTTKKETAPKRSTARKAPARKKKEEASDGS